MRAENGSIFAGQAQNKSVTVHTFWKIEYFSISQLQQDIQILQKKKKPPLKRNASVKFYYIFYFSIR